MSTTSDAPAGTRHRRLAFLHGFTQTHHSWHACAALIADRIDGHQTLVFADLPGHGLSSDDRSGIEAAGAELATTVGAATVVGYSMGGRTALHVALAAGNRVERLVLLGATPGLADPAARAARREADERRADHLRDVGVEAFIDEWLSAPLFARLPRDESALDQRRRNTVAGLANSLRTAGTGVQAPLWNRLPEIEIPVLVLAGELDDKFTEIGRRMAHLLPDATFATVPSAGHAAHAEQPEAVAELVAGWLQPG